MMFNLLTIAAIGMLPQLVSGQQLQSRTRSLRSSNGGRDLDGVFINSKAAKSSKTVDAKAEKASKASKVFNAKSSGKAENAAVTMSSNASQEQEVQSVDQFLDYAEKKMDEINSLICNEEGETYVAACASIAQLVSAGEGYKQLPRQYYLNYRAMTLAYPIMGSLGIEDPLFLPSIRVHRALGLGNSLRLQGYNEDSVNEGYWKHYSILELEDGSVQPMGDGIGAYCEYIAKEYQMLKDFSVKNYDETYDSASSFAKTENIKDSQMYKLCAEFNDIASYIVRNDWEHHRSEAVGSMMNTGYTESIVEYTIWHWESLFAVYSHPDLVIPQLFESMNALLPLAN